MRAVPTVFVVDDDDSVRRALRRLIQSVGLTVRTHASAAEFLAAYDANMPGCLVLDVRMPGLSGLDLQASFTERDITLPVIFITGHGDIPMSVRAMKAGALDFLAKPFNDQVLLDAIQRALAQDAEARRERAERDSVARRLESLTPRERQVMSRIVCGLTNRQVAAELGASEKTIKVHRARVMRKTQVNSLAELVLLAQAAGIRTPKVQSTYA